VEHLGSAFGQCRPGCTAGENPGAAGGRATGRCSRRAGSARTPHTRCSSPGPLPSSVPSLLGPHLLLPLPRPRTRGKGGCSAGVSARAEAEAARARARVWRDPEGGAATRRTSAKRARKKGSCSSRPAPPAQTPPAAGPRSTAPPQSTQLRCQTMGPIALLQSALSG